MSSIPSAAAVEDQWDDPDGWRLNETWDDDLYSTDPLGFPGYLPPSPDRESVRTGLVHVHGRPAVLIESRFDQHGGTMGAVAGERIVRALDQATRRGLPVVEIVASGGARPQEGMVSLVQMARTASAAAAHERAGYPRRPRGHRRCPGRRGGHGPTRHVTLPAVLRVYVGSCRNQ